ncbi:hypothetical protein GCM10010448_04340 [Streptomyces glomeratus]|uniref:Uncharacterized protein n=1 Tax=Streptomyces glomeratus TaxID=284452 RepID=A0ABN3YD42_9ACTN
MLVESLSERGDRREVGRRREVDALDDRADAAGELTDGHRHEGSLPDRRAHLGVLWIGELGERAGTAQD